MGISNFRHSYTFWVYDRQKIDKSFAILSKYTYSNGKKDHIEGFGLPLRASTTGLAHPIYVALIRVGCITPRLTSIRSYITLFVKDSHSMHGCICT